jgi:hypothetical protein
LREASDLPTPIMTTIYEPLYQPGQELSEPAFVPLRLEDNSQSAWREFRIMVDFYRSGRHRQKGFSGIFSPKFGLKTKLPGEVFVAFTQANSHADVCIVNPFPTMRYYSFNVWMQGEVAHPGLTACAQDLLRATGIQWDLSQTPRHNQSNLCYSNFWVGTERFWDDYVGGILNPIALYLEQNPDTEVSQALMSDTRHTDRAPFLPFVVERLFSTFLSLRPGIKVAAYSRDPIQEFGFCLTDFERDMVSHIRPAVDAADATGIFDSKLIDLMGLFCRLYQQYGTLHYAANKHPHSGRTVSSGE